MQKPKKLLWLQSISCNGNLHSFFNHPTLFQILDRFKLVYFPLIDTPYSLEDIYNKKVQCDILILEGAFNSKTTRNGVNILEVALHYAKMAKYIVTVGTCATFGGVFREKDRDEIEGFIFKGGEKNSRFDSFSKKVISISGCPIHYKYLSFALLNIEKNNKFILDEFNRPKELYGITVHNGCPRNEYFEWKIDNKNLGEKEGCLFYKNGCQAPYTRGSCNKILWGEISSKTTVGTPCFGCTEPTFPKKNLFFTKTNMGIPNQIPIGISKRAYLTVTGVAKSFKIERLESKIIEYKGKN